MNRLLFFIAFLLVFSACDLAQKNSPQQVTFRGQVFGTYYSVIFFDEEAKVKQESVDSLLEVFNQSLSYYVPNSVISRINRNETDEVDELFRRVYLRASEISRETNGAFDITVSPLVNAWGFGFSERESMSDDKVDSLLAFVGHQKARLDGDRIIKTHELVQFDLNAIAKGFATDVVGSFLESKGITAYLVEIGGDLLAKGGKPDGSFWRIGLESPAPTMDAPQEWEYFIEIRDVGLATSGNYRRYIEENGKRYSHTIDPNTGYPVTHQLLSVSVIAPDGMSADAYATAFMVMGLERAMAFVEARDDLEAFFVIAGDDNEFDSLASSGLELKKRPQP